MKKNKSYSIKTWNAYKKEHPILSWNHKKSSPVSLMEKGYRLFRSEDYSGEEVKSWKKLVEQYIQELQKESDDKYAYIDCVYYVYHSNQCYTFLDIYIKIS